ncbi:hypothetical protein E8E13_008158 [Curvularia kusanoi]|uniref:Uncharacterized protein n=1 Tax=Curvularia kusanoi TaxID=90978 RepID=A0A9P4TE61_CURKU|nr:hypothetical protein E8E13_008158 [Curvularia kusanoi]
MAKKKSKKNTQKQVEDTSAPATAPGTPKPTPAPVAEDVIPDIAEPTVEAQEAESSPADQTETKTDEPVANTDESVEEPTSELLAEKVTDSELPSHEEPETADNHVIGDGDATVSVEASAPEAEDLSTTDTNNDLGAASVPDGTTEDGLTAPVGEAKVEEEEAKTEPEAITEPAAKDDTEATIAPDTEPSASVPEPLPEAEPSSVDTQQDTEIPEATRDDVSNGHVDASAAATSEPPSVSKESEKPQLTEEASAEAPAETTQSIVTDTQEPATEDDWAPIPKKGKKAKKDKKKKQDNTAAVIDEAKPSPAEEAIKSEVVADQVAEKQTDEPTIVPQESVPQASEEADEGRPPLVDDKAEPEATVEPESIAQEPVVEPPATVEPAVDENKTARAPAPRSEPVPELPAAPAAAADPGFSNAEDDTCQAIPAALKQSPQSPHSATAAVTRSRAPEAPRLREAPAPPKAFRHLEEDKPPAPSPPVERARTRHVPAFDDDDDDDSDSALVHSRRQLRGGEALVSSRDSSGSRYPHHAAPAHHPRTSGFASRVPVEHYPNPPPPPGYHPRYGYQPGAPPYYPNQHGYGMSQPGYSNPNPYGPSSHNSSSPYQETWNQYPPGYPPNGSSHQHHDTSGSRDYGMGMPAIENGSSLFDGETADIFSRISQAIPDLHASLAKQKEVHGQLLQKLRAKDEEIYDLKERIISIENKHSAEAKEQVKELREQIAETHKHKREAEDTKLAWEASTKSWETKVKELETMYTAERAQAKKEFDEWKAAASTRHDAEKIALAIQYDKKLKEADLAAETLRQEEADAAAAEKEELRAELERQQQEREASFDEERNELETKLSAAQRDHEEAREHWLAEREALIRSHQEHSDSLQAGWSEEREALDARYQEAKEESDRAWAELHSEANRRADELTRERDDLLRKYEELKAESQKEKEIIKSVATNLESEKARLEKMMECYGDIAEIKSKGDTYYLVSFSQLQKQIIDLAATHFRHLPVRPPHEDLAQVPHNLPSFLGDTPASRQVRAAYITHTVSKLITYRVFGPFLFSLGRRYDKADSLFLSMSNHIRDKSTRKEAIWRQQTLLAAFTSSGAKQRINTAAGTVVEEIVNAIKHFADPREEEGIKIAVKRIVKLAAETWRFARLEREMITATMPALYDEEHQFTSAEFWPAYESTHKPDGTLIGSSADTAHPSGQGNILLRLFPVIYREPKHENFHANGEKNDEGCIYHHGMALYEDAEPVIARAEELKSAGLPSYTTASPTTAEFGKFPPPMVPPPRNPLPPTPAMSEKTTSVRTKSPPPSPTEGVDQSPRRRRTPPPPPSSIAALNEPLPQPVRAYQRPPPGPIDFATPRNIIGMPPPVESLFTQAPSKSSRPPSEPVFEETSRLLAEAASIPEPLEDLPEPTPADSETLPVFLEQEPPTPPRSPSGTPPQPASPLFEALDEIESLQSHRSQPTLRRRRSTRTRHTEEEELPDITPRPETLRRTSGYALSNRTLRSERSERTERTGKSERTERTEKPDLKTRYMCESRSAGVKALYPNSPMSMQNGKAFKEAMQAKRASKDSMRSDSHQKWLKDQREKKPEKQGRSERSERPDRPDRSERSERPERSERSDRGSRELRREKSMKSVTEIPDNGTWDTNSTLSSLETNTQFSINEH